MTARTLCRHLIGLPRLVITWPCPPGRPQRVAVRLAGRSVRSHRSDTVEGEPPLAPVAAETKARRRSRCMYGYSQEGASGCGAERCMPRLPGLGSGWAGSPGGCIPFYSLRIPVRPVVRFGSRARQMPSASSPPMRENAQDSHAPSRPGWLAAGLAGWPVARGRVPWECPRRHLTHRPAGTAPAPPVTLDATRGARRGAEFASPA